MRAMERRPGSCATVTLIVVMLLAVAPQATQAGTSRTRSPGVHFLIDDGRHAGATCVYEGTRFSSKLMRIRVRHPIVYAQDRRPNRLDRQTIGWRYLVQTSHDGFQWKVRARSRIWRATASDRVAADLDDRRWLVTKRNYRTRIIVRLFWYRDGEVTAKARLRAHYYLFRPIGRIFNGSCPNNN
jgi:hypothetical protein